MTTFRYRAVSLAAVVPFALGMAACGDDDDAATGSGDGGGAGSGAAAVEIASPAAGDEVGDSFDVEFASSEEIGPTDSGDKHFHLYYDGSDEYEVVESTSFTVDSLDEGEHTLTAKLANADHSETGDEDEISVTVGAGGGGSNTGDGEDDSGTTDDPYGY